MNARDFLETIPFFAEALKPEEMDALAAATRYVEFDKGSPLIAEDDSGDSMFIIREGTVTVSIHGADAERPVATLGPGEIVGEMSMLTGAARSATVAAKTRVVALEVDRDSIAPLVAAEPALFDHFAEMLEKRRHELDRIYGPSLFRHYADQHDDLAIVMRTFFGTRSERA